MCGSAKVTHNLKAGPLAGRHHLFEQIFCNFQIT